MARISMFHEPSDAGTMPYRAVAGRNQAMGRTAGEALDALATQLSEQDTETLVIVRNLRPDRFFTAGQRERLEGLMTRWRQAREENSLLSPEEQAELEQLIDAEIRASTERAAELVHELTP